MDPRPTLSKTDYYSLLEENRELRKKIDLVKESYDLTSARLIGTIINTIAEHDKTILKTFPGVYEQQRKCSGEIKHVPIGGYSDRSNSSPLSEDYRGFSPPRDEGVKEKQAGNFCPQCGKTYSCTSFLGQDQSPCNPSYFDKDSLFPASKQYIYEKHEASAISTKAQDDHPPYSERRASIDSKSGGYQQDILYPIEKNQINDTNAKNTPNGIMFKEENSSKVFTEAKDSKIKSYPPSLKISRDKYQGRLSEPSAYSTSADKYQGRLSEPSAYSTSADKYQGRLSEPSAYSTSANKYAGRNSEPLAYSTPKPRYKIKSDLDFTDNIKEEINLNEDNNEKLTKPVEPSSTFQQFKTSVSRLKDASTQTVFDDDNAQLDNREKAQRQIVGQSKNINSQKEVLSYDHKVHEALLDPLDDFENVEINPDELVYESTKNHLHSDKTASYIVNNTNKQTRNLHGLYSMLDDPNNRSKAANQTQKTKKIYGSPNNYVSHCDDLPPSTTGGMGAFPDRDHYLLNRPIDEIILPRLGIKEAFSKACQLWPIPQLVGEIAHQLNSRIAERVIAPLDLTEDEKQQLYSSSPKCLIKKLRNDPQNELLAKKEIEKICQCLSRFGYRLHFHSNFTKHIKSIYKIAQTQIERKTLNAQGSKEPRIVRCLLYRLIPDISTLKHVLILFDCLTFFSYEDKGPVFRW